MKKLLATVTIVAGLLAVGSTANAGTINFDWLKHPYFKCVNKRLALAANPNDPNTKNYVKLGCQRDYPWRR